MRTRNLALIMSVALLASGIAQTGRSDAGTGSHVGAQAAADLMRESAKSQAAFLTAGNLNAAFDEKNLASLMQFPTEQVVVVDVLGSDVRAALERSIALYPQPNRSFLQISGFTVEFNPSGTPNNRIRSVSIENGAMDEGKTYSIAMPLSLARGGMGYFKQWDKQKIVRTLPGTIEDILRDKRAASSPSRWVSRP